MREIKMRINKPQDGGSDYKTIISSELFTSAGSVRETIYPIRSAKDPLHHAMKLWFKKMLTKPKTSRWGYTNHRPNQLRAGDLEGVFYIKQCPISIIRKGGKYKINGKSESIATISNVLSRVMFKSCFTDDNGELMKTLFSALSLSEDIKYVLENRVPYHFFNDFEREEVRLNVAQIGDKEFALEIDDGVWGKMSMKDLQSFCGYYIHGRQNSKFRRMGLKRLYQTIIGDEPLVSDIKRMKAFLMQNRTKDLVENRAKQLLTDMANKHPTRIKMVWDDKGEPQTMYIVGNEYDWKLENSQYKSDIQMVSTFVRQPQSRTDYEKENRSDEPVWFWTGPICIDNMAKGSSLGDQFATRALAVMNDNLTVARVNTIKGYLKQKPNKNERVDINEMS